MTLAFRGLQRRLAALDEERARVARKIAEMSESEGADSVLGDGVAPLALSEAASVLAVLGTREY